MVQGRTWRSFAHTIDYDEMRVKGSTCAYVKKLALRRVDDDTVEAFVGLSADKSAKQLSEALWVGDWQKEQETRRGHKWRAIVEDASFDVVLPADEAIMRHGLQRSMHVTDAWRLAHAPQLQDFDAGEVVLAADGRSATRTICGSVPTGSDGSRTACSAVVLYRLRPEGESVEAARQRADANRDEEEKAILSLHDSAAAAARAQRSVARSEQRAGAHAREMEPVIERKRLLGELMAEAGLERLYDPATPVESARFLESADFADLLMLDVPVIEWLDELQRCLVAYHEWYSTNAKEPVSGEEVQRPLLEVAIARLFSINQPQGCGRFVGDFLPWGPANARPERRESCVKFARAEHAAAAANKATIESLRMDVACHRSDDEDWQELSLREKLRCIVSLTPLLEEADETFRKALAIAAQECFGALQVNANERAKLNTVRDAYSRPTWQGFSLFAGSKAVSNEGWHLKTYKESPTGYESKWSSTQLEQDAAHIARLGQPWGQRPHRAWRSPDAILQEVDGYCSYLRLPCEPLPPAAQSTLTCALDEILMQSDQLVEMLVQSDSVDFSSLTLQLQEIQTSLLHAWREAESSCKARAMRLRDELVAQEFDEEAAAVKQMLSPDEAFALAAACERRADLLWGEEHEPISTMAEA